MKTNRDLLKEAIADAKAVKETAIANAKAALEEAFTPHLKELFASKLEEMELDEEEDTNEMMYDEMEEAKKEKSEKSKMEEEMDLEELLAELNEAEEEGEAEEKEEEGEAEEEAEGEEEVEVSEMSEEDLKTFIEDVIKDMVSAGELETGGEKAEMGAEAGTEETGSEETVDEEVNLDELLAEVEMEKEKVDEISPDIVGDITDPQALAAIAGAITLALGVGADVYKEEIKSALKKGKNALISKVNDIKSKLKENTSEAELE